MIRKSKRLLLVMLFSAGGMLAYGQKKLTVSGVVKDNLGNVIPGATINVKGTKKSVAADVNGRFQLNEIADNATLIFSSVGYANQEAKVAGGSVTIILQNDVKDNETVVVTALGIKRDARAIGYSVQKVTSENITKAAPASVATGLMGKVSGLNISTPGGVEGGSTRVIIRGNTSFKDNNQPLIVIDNVPISNTSFAPGFGTQGAAMNVGTGSEGIDMSSNRDFGSALNFINSDDIEEVSVLKGPAAAALYGARGANGVILITRKKGTQRKGWGVDYSFSHRTNEMYKYLDFQNEYGPGMIASMYSANPRFPMVGGKRTVAGSWTSLSPTAGDAGHGTMPGGMNSWAPFSWYDGASWGPKFDGQPILWYDGVERPYAAKPDNWKYFFPRGYTNDHNVALSSGGENGTMRMSYSRKDNKANVLNSNFKQDQFGFGASLKATKKVTVDLTASYVNFRRLNSPEIGSSNSPTSGIIYNASRYYDPEIDYMNTYRPDGSLSSFSTAVPGVGNVGYPWGGYVNGLMWRIFENNTTMNRSQFTGAVQVKANVTNWFDLTGRVGMDNGVNDFETRNKPTNANGRNGGSYSHSLTKDVTQNMDVIGRFYKDHLFEDFNASLSVGGSTNKRNLYTMNATNSGPFVRPFVYTLDNNDGTGDRRPSESRYVKQLNSLYSFADLSYKDYMFLQLTYRNDWSSTLKPGNWSYGYPSANLGFAFTNAFDLGSLKNVLNYGKVRLSYAETGSDTDPYMATPTLSVGSWGGAATTAFPGQIPPADLMPQRSRSYEAGLQLRFLNRINADFTFYTMGSFNQILDANLSNATGFSSVKINSGELKNKGFEFSIQTSVIKKQNLSWDVTINGAHNRNWVKSLAPGIEKIPLGNMWGADKHVSQWLKPGEEYGVIYGRDFTYNKDGKKIVERVYAPNDPTKVIGTKYVVSSTIVPIGNATPKLTGGVGNTVRYKNFSLYGLVDFKLGGDTYFMTYAAAMGNGLLKETTKERDGGGLLYTYPDGTKANTGVILDGVFADGKPNTDVVHHIWKYQGVYGAWSDVAKPRSSAVFENTWSKLREVALTYTVPSSVVAKTKVFQNLSASLIGRDLFYLYKSIPAGLNPEGIIGVGNAQGIEYSAPPQMRSYGISVKASF